MPTERVTEGIVRDHLRAFSFPGQMLEEQASDDPRIRKLLAHASKRGDGRGLPEFILRLPDDPDLVVIVECKLDHRHHASATLDHPVEYAVDGVLWYAQYLARDFDVVAVAVSGSRAGDLKVSTYRQVRGSLSYDELQDEHGPVHDLRPVSEYRRLLKFDPAVRHREHEDLMAFSRDLHNFMRDYAKLSENEKPLAVSGILLALRDDVFSVTWRKYKVGDLAAQLLAAIKRQIRGSYSARVSLWAAGLLGE
jgi:hypothetical protein